MSELNKDARVVIVEDSMDDAQLAMRVIKNVKFVSEVQWLKDGEDALNYFKGEGAYKGRDLSRKPNLILLDLKMPKISGVEVLTELKKNKDYDDVPVVVMTSSREEKDLEKCYTLGANSYVVKPINHNDFMSLAETVSQYWTSINEIPEQQ